MPRFTIWGVSKESGETVTPVSIEVSSEQEAEEYAHNNGIMVTLIQSEETDPTPPTTVNSQEAYHYTTSQLPTVTVKEGNEAAVYLKKLINGMAERGWEFYRVDPMSVEIEPGCLGTLLGQSSSYTSVHVAVFRKRRSD